MRPALAADKLEASIHLSTATPEPLSVDPESQRRLRALVREQRIGSLATLREGAPSISLVPVAPLPDLSGFLIHASRLAYHTQDFLADPRAALLLAETDAPGREPQSLARLSLRARVEPLSPQLPAYASLGELYLHRFPEARITFSLADFQLYAILPVHARYVAGLGKTFNLGPAELTRIALLPD